MMKRLFYLPLLFLSATVMLPFGAVAQSDAVKKIKQMAIEDNRVMEHLDILCNRFGGRLVGSANFDNAVEWAVREFESWGLEVTTEKAGEVGVGFNRAGWWGRMLGEESMQLHFVTPSYTVGTKGVQRGHVLIEPRTQQEFDRMRGRLKGAWVLVNGTSDGWAIKHDEKSRERRHQIIKSNAEAAAHNRSLAVDDTRRKTIDNRTPALFYHEMVEAGVLGFIQSSEVPMRALYDVEVVRDGVTFDSLPAVPDIKLNEEQYERIYKYAKQRKDIILEFDIRNHFKIGPVPYHNVIAQIKGAKYPEEYVVVGAHLDAYDVATGGVDCGSGTSAVMEAARMLALSGAKPDRTIIFVLFAAEEFGLLGSRAWVEKHKDKLPHISNMFNRDGGPMPYTAFWAPKSLYKEYEKVVKPIRELYPDYDFQLDTLKPTSKPTRYGGNDTAPFGMAGVPIVQMREYLDTKGYNFNYHEIWHTERDTYNKSIPEYQKQAAATLALMVLGTANLSQPFPREEVFK